MSVRGRSGPRIRAERVRLDRGGYDRHGRYWGVGEPLYYVYPWDDWGESEYVRAPSAKAARAKSRFRTTKHRRSR